MDLNSVTNAVLKLSFGFKANNAGFKEAYQKVGFADGRLALGNPLVKRALCYKTPVIQDNYMALLVYLDKDGEFVCATLVAPIKHSSTKTQPAWLEVKDVAHWKTVAGLNRGFYKYATTAYNAYSGKNVIVSDKKLV